MSAAVWMGHTRYVYAFSPPSPVGQGPVYVNATELYAANVVFGPIRVTTRKQGC
jgi:hypothetical protein